MRSQPREPTLKGRATQKVIGLILRNMPHAAETRVHRQLREVAINLRAAQVHPTHHAFDQRRLVGEPEQPAGFFHALQRLHRHGAVNPRRRQ